MSPPGSTRTASPVRLDAATYAFAANGPTTACRTTSIGPSPYRDRRRDGRSSGGSGRERRAAAAGRAGVRVVELEPGALEADHVVDRHALQVHRAHRVDVETDAVLLEREVAVLRLLLEVHRVLEPGAAA